MTGRGLSQVTERVLFWVSGIPKKPQHLWTDDLPKDGDEHAYVEHECDPEHPVEKVRCDGRTDRKGRPLRSQSGSVSALSGGAAEHEGNLLAFC